jgi:hypothetical protein
MENGSTDEGDDIAMEVETRDFAGDEGSNILKLYQFMRVDADTLGEYVNIDFYLDDTRRATLYLSHSGRTSKLYNLPPSLLGYKWRAKVRYTGASRIRVYSAGTMYVPLSAA